MKTMKYAFFTARYPLPVACAVLERCANKHNDKFFIKSGESKCSQMICHVHR